MPSCQYPCFKLQITGGSDRRRSGNSGSARVRLRFICFFRRQSRRASQYENHGREHFQLRQVLLPANVLGLRLQAYVPSWSLLPRPELDPDAGPHKRGRAQRADRRARHVVALVGQILGGDERFRAVAERVRDQRVKREEVLQPELVLVVIELRSDESSLHSESQAGEALRGEGIRVASLESELMARHLGNPQAPEQGVGGKAQDGRVCKLVASGELDIMVEP